MQKKEFFLEVIFPAKLRQTFTYKPITDNTLHYFKGQRVLVPLQKRLVIGFVHQIHFNRPDYKLRSITQIIDTKPIFPGELYLFLEKLSDYYLAPLGMVLDSALPFEIKMQKFRTFYPIGNSKLNAPYQDVFDIIVQRPGISFSALKLKFEKASLNKALNALKLSHYIEEKPDFSAAKVKKKVQKTIYLATGFDSDPINSRGVKQQEIINYLKENNQIHHDRISFFSASAIKALRDKGMITIEENDVTMDHLMDQFLIKQKTIQLNEEQEKVYEKIDQAIKVGRYKGFLLHGVTGSGKTEVYIKLIESALKMDKCAIILVPEIALTTHLANRFFGAFGNKIAVWHSNLSSIERSNIWHKIASGEIRIVIGARSALFMPMHNLGLIIVDEEHEQSYKQQNPAPRYHARDAALLRGSLSHSVVLLGSATPSLETHYNALMGKLEKLVIPNRFTSVRPNRLHLVDIKKEFEHTTSPYLPFSKFLLEKIQEKLQKGQQILLFHNRRGYSNFLLCNQCGWSPKCSHCDITLTYHKNINQMVCHYCDHWEKIPHQCPECGNRKFLYPGFGTQKVETILEKRFPKIKIARLDMDSTARRGHMQKVLQDFEKGEIQVIVGTQMIAKGLDFPNVSLVGVLNADIGLFLPDFRSREKVFQLLHQVSGRAGRGNIAGEVIIQTYNPEDFTVNCALQQDIVKFINNEYSERNQMNYPPFARLATINFAGKNEARVRQISQDTAAFLQTHNQQKMEILGPVSNPISKIKNLFRYFILLKSRKEIDPSGANLRRLITLLLQNEFYSKTSSVNISVDIDPQGLL
ncbi:MAG: primosomal protein N' [Candidatus Marinimicrobia bacterium]|nr:primosomal protein N' [Candidatus Neomarinimicrobiota bacterium]